MIDYEKKYNEALERAQKTTRAGGDVAMEIVQYIFPELRESEDERIINQLITLVNSAGEVLLIPTNKEELIAWLNKCKESLHIPETCKENQDSLTLEEAAEKIINDALYKWSYDDEDGIEQYVHDAFIAGAEWMKEQMLKDAVEGEVHPDDCEIWVNLVGYGYKFNDGDKVRIVVLKEEE